MMENLMDTGIVKVGGVTSVGASAYMNIYNIFSVDNINTGLIILTTIAGLLFIIAKIRGQLLDNSIKRRQLEKLEHECSINKQCNKDKNIKN